MCLLGQESIPFHPALTIGFHVKELAKLWGLKSRPYTPYLHATLGLGDSGWGGRSLIPFSLILASIGELLCDFFGEE